MVQADRATFYNTRRLDARRGAYPKVRDVYYAEAYTFVHMLLHDRGGQRRLQDYVRDLARADGKDTDAITNKYFDGKTCDRLSIAWARYVNSRPDSRRRGGP